MDKTNTKELRQFGISTGLLFGLIFGLLIPWLWNSSYPMWPWYVGGTLLFFGIILPGLLAPVFSIWMKIAHVLGWINTRIIMGLIFYVVFMPISMFFKLIGKDPMLRRFDRDTTTYRKTISPDRHHNMEKPF